MKNTKAIIEKILMKRPKKNKKHLRITDYH